MTVTWYVQNVVVIGKAHFKPKHSKFCSNLKFDQNIISGMGVRSDNKFPSVGMSPPQQIIYILQIVFQNVFSEKNICHFD